MQLIKTKELLRLPLFLSLQLFATISLANPQTAAGYWRTIDDVTGKPRSIIELKQDDQNAQGNQSTLSGYIREVLAIPGVESHKTCVKCKGELKDQPIVGLRMLWDMKPENSESSANSNGSVNIKNTEWHGGHILDPKNGKVYSCKMRLSADGKELEVRGFIGISLLGRSQTWYRVEG